MASAFKLSTNLLTLSYTRETGQFASTRDNPIPEQYKSIAGAKFTDRDFASCIVGNPLASLNLLLRLSLPSTSTLWAEPFQRCQARQIHHTEQVVPYYGEQLGGVLQPQDVADSGY